MGETVTGAVTNLMGVVTTVISYVTDNAVLAVCFVAGGYAGRLGVKHRASGYGGFSAFLVVLCIVCLYLVPHYRFVPDECGFGSCEEGV